MRASAMWMAGLAWASGGCGGGNAPAGDDAVTADATAADSPASDAGADEAVDVDLVDAPAEPGPESCAASWVATIDGAVVSTSGEPVEGALAQMCVRVGAADGNLVCLRPQATDEAGAFAIDVPASARCMGGGALRVYSPDQPFATTYCDVEVVPPTGTDTLSLPDPFVVFPTTPASDLPAYGNAAALRTVSFGALAIDLAPDAFGFTFGEAEYGRLAAAAVDPTTPGLCFLDTPVDALWAFSPEANADKPVDFRLDNAQGYPPGSAVDLWILGGLDTTLAGGEHVPEAEWVQFGEARVSDDGATIVGEAPALTWLGLRRAD